MRLSSAKRGGLMAALVSVSWSNSNGKRSSALAKQSEDEEAGESEDDPFLGFDFDLELGDRERGLLKSLGVAIEE